MRAKISPFKRTSQTAVHLGALDRYGFAGLAAAMGNRTASQLFRSVFDPLDKLREAKDIAPKTIAEKCGFKRSAWFVYKARGTMPFHFLERVAHYLGAELQLVTKTGVTGVQDRVPPSPAGGDQKMREYIEPLMELLEEVPEERRQYAAGAIFAAAREAVRSLPFVEPSAGKRASRGRSSKS